MADGSNCRRGRRPRYQSHQNWYSSVFVLSSGVAVIYLMLIYHSETCNAKNKLTPLTKNIDDIMQNLVTLKSNYYDLEAKLSHFSQEIPKIQGHIELIESLSKQLEQTPCRVCNTEMFQIRTSNSHCHNSHSYHSHSHLPVFKYVTSRVPLANQTKCKGENKTIQYIATQKVPKISLKI